MDKTIFRQEEKKYKPVNKQAALIVRRASWLHQPPPPTVATFAPTMAEVIAAESKIRLARIAAIEAEGKERRERRAAIRLANAKPEKPKVIKNKWLVKHMRHRAKSMGLPKPTIAEIRAKQRSLPNYGKPLYATST